MKIFELFQPLLEYSRDVTLQKMSKQLQGISATTKLEPADVLERLENIDPTKIKQDSGAWAVYKREFKIE